MPRRRCARPNLPGRSLTALEIARPYQHGEAVRHEILRDLKTESLISPRDQGDGFVLHSNFLFLHRCPANVASPATLEQTNSFISITLSCMYTCMSSGEVYAVCPAAK